MLDTFALILILAINLLLITVVLSRNTKNSVNRLFAAMTGAVSLWAITNFTTNHVFSYFAQLWSNRLAFAAGFFMVIWVWLFSTRFPFQQHKKNWQNILAWILAPLTLALSLSPMIVDSVIYRSDRQVTDITTGSLYPIYLVSILTFLGLICFNFVRAYRRSDRTSRAQILTVAGGIIATFIWILFTSAVIPAITNDWSISKFGGVGSVLLVSATAYAIVRHGLFDIRLFVARSVTYVFSLGTLLSLYGAAVFIASRTVFVDQNTSIARQLFYASTAVVAALTFPPIKKGFDSLTTRIFYRDRYDSQEFLKQANGLLVGQIHLEQLLKGITNVIEQNLKTSYCVFIIRETAYEDTRIVGTDDHKFKNEKIKQLRDLAPHTHRKVLVTDELADAEGKLEDVLKDLDISVLIRLVSNADQDLEGMGYLVLGPKKNGTIYSTQDKQVLDILANEMVIAVENALRYEEIQKFADTLQEKVDEQTKSLRKANEKLKTLDETKDEFISMASHQLRTPLTSVKGYLSMVLEGDVGTIPEMQRKLLDQAFVSSQRMVYLIADLLNVSRLRTGKFIIEQAPTNLAEVVQEEFGQLTETAKARELEFSYDKPEEFPEVMLDDTKIRQVVMNFMDNAIYYTPSGGHIKVQVNDTGKTVEYTVTDNGLGVPKWDQAHLFTKFYRAGNAKKARPDGTGLGLFMAKKVVVAQGGSIIFKSEEGKGSTFGFSFDKDKLQKMADEQAKKEETTHPKPSEVEKATKNSQSKK